MIPALPLLPHAELLTVFLLLSAFVGLLVSVILAFVNTVQRHANRLLSLSLFSVALFALTSALLINHAIFLVPHLFRVNMPLHYLVAPCAYLYVRSLPGNTVSPPRLAVLRALWAAYAGAAAVSAAQRGV